MIDYNQGKLHLQQYRKQIVMQLQPVQCGDKKPSEEVEENKATIHCAIVSPKQFSKNVHCGTNAYVVCF